MGRIVGRIGNIHKIFLFMLKKALVNMMGKMLYLACELNLPVLLLLWEAIDTYRGTYYILVYIQRDRSKHDGKKCYIHCHTNLDPCLMLLLLGAIDTYVFTMFLFIFREAEPININEKSYTLPYELDLYLVVLSWEAKIIEVDENCLNCLNGLQKLI